MVKWTVDNYAFWALGAILIVFILVSCKSIPSQIEKVNTGVYLKKVYSSKKGNLNYRIFYPNGFDALKEYPVLLFLHGAGERGDDNEAQLVHGSELIAAGMNKYNAITIFPQCPKEDYWVKFIDTEERSDERSFDIDVSGSPSDALGLVIDLMNKVKSESYIDKNRLYVTGLSMGGMATFDLLWRMPNTFAAAMPICGAGSPEKVKSMIDVPIRIFHGEDDSVVPVVHSKEMEAALLTAGGKPEVFYYPGVNHDSWTSAFAEPDFLSWVFGQRKG